MSASIELHLSDVIETRLSQVFKLMYTFRAPWEIRQPQPAIVKLFKEGKITGRVLDVGCGTGENSIYLAEQGLEVLGIDLPAARLKRHGETS